MGTRCGWVGLAQQDRFRLFSNHQSHGKCWLDLSKDSEGDHPHHHPRGHLRCPLDSHDQEERHRLRGNPRPLLNHHRDTQSLPHR